MLREPLGIKRKKMLTFEVLKLIPTLLTFSQNIEYVISHGKQIYLFY